ncbi:MAG: phospholipase D-like domain-containing protein [Actinomycetota bacterium]|nr:phospholipase D-like domain-containing protein [Actinomycetota bacterium]
MPHAGRLALLLALLGLTATLTTVPAATAGAASGESSATISLSSAVVDERSGRGFTPPSGALLSDPMIGGRKRLILNRVIRSVRNTAKGEFIRLAVWNYDDRATTNALLDAHHRGVHVQVVVANSVRNGNWNRTVAALNANRKDRSFAVRCRGGCRSAAILHAKFVLISRVRKAHNISMVGSFNLTRAAGFRQWNDLVTTRDKEFYRSLVGTFHEYARDHRLARPFQVTDLGKQKITLWPSIGRNTIRDELERVRCKIPADEVRNGQRRTKIRIAIAGWFDDFGTNIAKQLRTLWGRGCDIKIITTLAGRGVNRTLRSRRGRGPVPIRQVAIDRNQDRVPERYLHMKAMAITGFFDGDPRADVLITGSPNWSARAQRSDEIVVRFLDVPKLARQYSGHVDRLYSSPWSHRRTTAEPLLARMATGSPALPEWFELD